MPSFVTVTIRCSAPGCDKVKGETNHWFRWYTEDRKIVFDRWQDGDEHIVGVQPLCGQACAQKVLSTWS